MTATAIGPVEDALLVALLADPTLVAIEGPPQLGPPADPQYRHVWIEGDVTVDNQQVTISSGAEREESFELTVGCFAALTGSNFPDARDRSAALADLVANVVSANFHLTFQVGIVDLHVVGVTRSYGADDTRQFITHAVRIGCTAVLT